MGLTAQMLGLERCNIALFGYSAQTSLVLTSRGFKCNNGKDSNQQATSLIVPKKSSSSKSSLIKSKTATNAELQENKAGWRAQKIKTAEVAAADVTSAQRLWNAGLVWVNFVATLWAIWVHRNEVVFNEVELRTLWTRAEYWMSGYPSTKGFISIVVDGSWAHEDRRKTGHWGAAVAWVAEKTSHSNNPSLQGSKLIDAETSEQTECYAIWYGISEAAKMYKNVIVKTDCSAAIKVLNNPKRAPDCILPIIRDIREITNKLHSCICICVYRHDVSRAHNLAVLTRKKPSKFPH